MRPFLPFLLVPALLLAGCQVPRDQAVAQTARTANATAPLVQRCQAEFTKSLAGLPVTYPDGPSVTNYGDAISVRLEAEAVDPNIIDRKAYSCDFENGVLTHSGPA